MNKAKTADIDTMRAVVKAGIFGNEAAVVAYLLGVIAKKGVNSIALTHKEMADVLGMNKSNFQRAMNSLKQKNVVGERSNKVFVKSPNSWKKPKE